jgi:hypothetical protein
MKIFKKRNKYYMLGNSFEYECKRKGRSKVSHVHKFYAMIVLR